ncbi:MAG: (d)CMP kinase [Oscillospiraceae bacterium]|nr:(d)CMP kinase [Oscillospiraceae bacterium]
MPSIAIDGPSGAGKSTIARSAAAQLGFIHVDTGALYRAIGLFAHRAGISDRDEAALSAHFSEIQVELDHRGEEQAIFLNGEDVSEEIRKPEISMAASNVSALPAVRAFLLDLQREMAVKYSVIMDGRDIGTVVLPNADLKIFLTATSEDRAMRRYLELVTFGEKVRYEEVLADLKRRDKNDSERAAAPLKQADDAILLDTTGNEMEESVLLVIKTIRERGVG